MPIEYLFDIGSIDITGSPSGTFSIAGDFSNPTAVSYANVAGLATSPYTAGEVINLDNAIGTSGDVHAGTTYEGWTTVLGMSDSAGVGTGAALVDGGGAALHVDLTQSGLTFTLADGSTYDPEAGAISMTQVASYWDVTTGNVNLDAPTKLLASISGLSAADIAAIDAGGGVAGMSVDGSNSDPASGITMGQGHVHFGDSGISTGVLPGPVCFTNGTWIETQDGEKLVDDLEIGDMVKTFDNGYQPVRFVYKRKMAVTPTTRPIVFEKGAIGNTDVLRVSQKHRISTIGLKEFGYKGMLENQLIWAQGLINGTTVRIDMECKEVEYFHIMFDKHELVHTHGVVSESWQPHRRNLKRDKALRDELMAIFPEINHKGSHNEGGPARSITYAACASN